MPPILSPSAGMLTAACHHAQVQQEGCAVGGGCLCAPPAISKCWHAEYSLPPGSTTVGVCVLWEGGSVCPPCYLQVLACRQQLATRLNWSRVFVLLEGDACVPPLLSPSAGMLITACHQAQLQQEGCAVGGRGAVCPPLLSSSVGMLNTACQQAQLQQGVCAVGGGRSEPPL